MASKNCLKKRLFKEVYTQKKYIPPDQDIFHQGTMPWVSKKLRISVEFICCSGPKSNKLVNINVASRGLDIKSCYYKINPPTVGHIFAFFAI